MRYTLFLMITMLIIAAPACDDDSKSGNNANNTNNTNANNVVPPTLAWVTSPETTPVAQAVTFEGSITGEGSDTLATSWTVYSGTAADVDCSDLIWEQTRESVTLLIPGDADPRCADELVVEWLVGEGESAQTLSATLEVVPTPGRVTDFEEIAGNPQPDIGGCPTWHCLNHSDPTLGRLPGGSLAVWAATSGIQENPDFAGFPVVGRFVLQDDGSWVADASPSLNPADVPDGAWALARETPSIRWNAEAGAWDMWFLGYSVSYFDDPGIGQLRSQDAEGTLWGSSDAPIYRPAAGSWDEDFITSPGALRGSDGVWRLYYAGASFAIENGRMRVGVLTSTDGETWTAPAEPVVFEGVTGAWDEGILDPHVQFVGGRYVMWYTGYVPPLDVDSDQLIAVGVAVSEDGYHFERVTEEPVIAPVPNSWSDRRVLDVEVLCEPDGSLIMVGYALSNTVPHPYNAELFPGRLGLWQSQ